MKKIFFEAPNIARLLAIAPVTISTNRRLQGKVTLFSISKSLLLHNYFRLNYQDLCRLILKFQLTLNFFDQFCC